MTASDYGIHPFLKEKLNHVKCVLMDVDGVWTDGGMYFSNTDEYKKFHVHDGMGISMLHLGGIRTGVITGKKSGIVSNRAEQLRISYVYQGNDDKITQLEDLLQKTEYTDKELCYVGDDLLDLPILNRVGLAVAVANACEEVKMASDVVTDKSGGNGAIRELAELILKAQGKWQMVLDLVANPETKKVQ